VLEEKKEDMERLFLDSDPYSVLSQFTRAFVEFKRAESKRSVRHGDNRRST
jgi:hypothetical protein